MLKKETIEAFANFSGVSASDLEAKIKSESEEDITLREVQVFTNEELDSRIKNEKSTSYNEGKDAGVEMLVKNKKKKLGYDFEGKDLDSLFKFHTTKIKAGSDKPNEKITELEQDIININKAHKTVVDSLESKYIDIQGKLNSSIISNELLSIIPEKTVIPKSDLVTLFNYNFTVEKEEGKTIVKQHGETIKDQKTATPLSLKDVFMNYATEKKYIVPQGGRGGGNESGDQGSNAKSISQFQTEMEKQGINLNSPEYQTKYADWRKVNKEVTA